MSRFAALAAFVAFGLTTAASAGDWPRLPEPQDAAPAVATPVEEVAVLTGRWRLFFGSYLCAGQRFDIPGESQCV